MIATNTLESLQILWWVSCPQYSVKIISIFLIKGWRNRDGNKAMACKTQWGAHRTVCSQATAIRDCSTYWTHYCMVSNHLRSISQPSAEPSRSSRCFPLYRGSRPRKRIQPAVLLKNCKQVFLCLYFFVLTFLFTVTKPMVLFAVLVILLMCEFQLRSAIIFTPRYLAESWDWSSWPCM